MLLGCYRDVIRECFNNVLTGKAGSTLDVVDKIGGGGDPTIDREKWREVVSLYCEVLEELMRHKQEVIARKKLHSNYVFLYAGILAGATVSAAAIILGVTARR